MRSILLDKNETAWLIKSFDDLVTVKDSRVLWNQSFLGYPWILAQQCSNRHGFFLVLEEFEGRRRSGSILVPQGSYWLAFLAPSGVSDDPLSFPFPASSLGYIRGHIFFSFRRPS
jgi:hypothetical protein